ncbi:MAG: oxidoreductase, partial [Leadbetterella sp.]|nr:oxidoreductase [Leadbetterella sp.]
MNTFRRLSVSVSASGEVTRTIENARLEQPVNGDILVKVAYSGLNYKDALSASGNKGISRFYPHTPGIDA